MAFTAGSPELAKAIKLANQLAALYQTYGAGFSGAAAALTIEDAAQRLGFGITGLTTGNGFPPFGSVLPSQNSGLAAALQNPRGETMANGITLSSSGLSGATVGIYMHKFVRTGEDYRATMLSGVTLSLGYTAGSGNTFTARGPVTIHTNDRVEFPDATYVVVSGFTSAGAGGTAAFRVLGSFTNTYATGAAFNTTTIGVTRGTSGVAGSTFEGYPRNTTVNAGFTACIFFGLTSGTGFTGTVS
jgi:hypothetical protein